MEYSIEATPRSVYSVSLVGTFMPIMRPVRGAAQPIMEIKMTETNTQEILLI